MQAWQKYAAEVHGTFVLPVRCSPGQIADPHIPEVRPYGENPYAGYDDPGGDPFLFRARADDRAREMQRVAGINSGGEAVANSLDLLRDDAGASATAVTIGGLDLVIFWNAGQASAFDDRAINTGRDVGSAGVFIPVADGRMLSSETIAGEIRDLETGSLWSISGQGVDGLLEGSTMDWIPHLDTFWSARRVISPEPHSSAPEEGPARFDSEHIHDRRCLQLRAGS